MKFAEYFTPIRKSGFTLESITNKLSNITYGMNNRGRRLPIPVKILTKVLTVLDILYYNVIQVSIWRCLYG